MDTAQATRQKALTLNLDARTYGTFAEIGGGQEVARWFFAVGGAAGTLAKTISAYDMGVSDGIYGPTSATSAASVSRPCSTWSSCRAVREVGAKRGDAKCFFAFANIFALSSKRQSEV